MKKTLITLLVVALMLGTFGTVSFAATEAEMTPIPDGPAIEQRYVHFQADSSIKTPGYEDYVEMNGNYARGTEPPCSTCGAWHGSHRNFSYGGGYFSRENWQSGGVGESLAKSFASYATGVGRNGVDSSRYGFHRSGWDFANSAELAFEKLGSDNNENVTVDSGYLMLHNDGVVLSANYASFGFGLVSGQQIGCGNMQDDYLYVAVVLEGNDTDGWKSYLQFLNTRHPKTTIGWSDGGQYREIEISDYVKKDVEFDIKVLADLDTDTYSIYIDNRPMVLSCLGDPIACPEIGGINFATTMVNGWEAKFATTTCYPMSEADVNQFKQAAWERAFNTDNFVDVPGTDNKGIRLFTAWGGNYENGEHAPEFSTFFDSAYAEVDWGNKMTLKHEGLEGLSLATMWTAPVACNYNSVYLTGTNFADVYDYDKLELLILSGEPVVDVVTGSIEGTYIAAGGRGMQSIPRVISASYVKTGDYETLYDAKVTEGVNGVYSGSIQEVDIPETDDSTFVHYIWGGFDRITPLFGKEVL